jgi:hypothetical protein
VLPSFYFIFNLTKGLGIYNKNNGNALVGQIAGLSNRFRAMLRSLSQPGGLNKDPSVWLEPPSNYELSNHMSLTNFKIW